MELKISKMARKAVWFGAARPINHISSSCHILFGQNKTYVTSRLVGPLWFQALSARNLSSSICKIASVLLRHVFRSSNSRHFWLLVAKTSSTSHTWRMMFSAVLFFRIALFICKVAPYVQRYNWHWIISLWEVVIIIDFCWLQSLLSRPTIDSGANYLASASLSSSLSSLFSFPQLQLRLFGRHMWATSSGLSRRRNFTAEFVSSR